MKNETPFQTFFPVIAPLIMCKGVGDGKTTSCLLAQTHTIAELARGKVLDVPSDNDEGVCPVLRRVGIRLNDGGWWKDDMERTETLRPLIPLLLGSKGDAAMTDKRLAFMCDKAVRELTPMRLERIASNTKSEELKVSIANGIKRIRDLEPITDKAKARVARDVCTLLKSSAYAYTYAYASASAYAYASTSTSASASASAYADASAQRIKYRDALLNALRECAAIK